MAHGMCKEWEYPWDKQLQREKLGWDTSQQGYSQFPRNPWRELQKEIKLKDLTGSLSASEDPRLPEEGNMTLVKGCSLRKLCSRLTARVSLICCGSCPMDSWLRALLWSPTKPCSKPSVDPPHWPYTQLKILECLYLGLLHLTEIYSHLIRVHFSPPRLDYEFSAARKAPSISLWPWTIGHSKSRLFSPPSAFDFRMLTQRQRISSGSLQLTLLIGDSNYRKLRQAPPICSHSIRKFFVLIQHFVQRLIKSSHVESNLIKTLVILQDCQKILASLGRSGVIKCSISRRLCSSQKPGSSGWLSNEVLRCYVCLCHPY